MRRMLVVAVAVLLTGVGSGTGAEGDADARARERAAQEEARAKARVSAEAARRALVEKVRPFLRQADPKLVEQAAEEAQQPVHPGEPGERGFWNIRHGIAEDSARFIYPPSFDFEEVPGATRYRLSSPDFDASEILHFYGRLRKEGGCDRFVDVEKKALQWMMDNSVKTFYWRDHPGNDGPHQPLGNVSFLPASYFVRYLLDWAEPSEANLKVAEEVLRFCEDQYINWGRSADGLGAPSGSSLFAVIYLKMYERTKRPLDMAKTEALANAALRDGEASNLHEYAELLKRVKR